MAASGRSRFDVIAEWSVPRDFGVDSRQVIGDRLEVSALIETLLLTTRLHWGEGHHFLGTPWRKDYLIWTVDYGRSTRFAAKDGCQEELGIFYLEE